MSNAYDTFVQVCKRSMGYNETRGTIEEVNLKQNTCVLRVEDNKTLVPIETVVRDVLYNGMGIVTNPSVLRKWKGWKTLGK